MPWTYHARATRAHATRVPCILPTTAQILKNCGFPYPITLSMCGVLFSALVSHVALRTGLVPFGRPDLLGSSRFYLRSSLPIGCLSALTLGLGNMAYLHLSVAACQILKTLTPVITLGLGALLGVERTTPRLAACVMLICIGTMVASQGELAMAGVGVALQLGANLSGARRPPRRPPRRAANPGRPPRPSPTLPMWPRTARHAYFLRQPPPSANTALRAPPPPCGAQRRHGWSCRSSSSPRTSCRSSSCSTTSRPRRQAPSPLLPAQRE